MTLPRKTYRANKSTDYFFRLCKLVYLAGFPNLWIEELDYSKRFFKFYGYFSKCVNGILYLFIVLEWAAFFTQRNLTAKQSSDSTLFNYSHPILFSYRLIITYHQEKVRELIFSLSVKLKEVYNDKDVEKNMIRKAKLYSISFSAICSISLLFYGVDAIMFTLKTGVWNL